MDRLYRLQTLSVLTSTFNGAVLWDMLICLPSETTQLYWPQIRQKSRPSLSIALLLAARLLVIPTLSTSFLAIDDLVTKGDGRLLYKTHVFLLFAASSIGSLLIVCHSLAMRKAQSLISAALFAVTAALLGMLVFCALFSEDLFITLTVALSPTSIVDSLIWSYGVHISLILIYSVALITDLRRHIQSFSRRRQTFPTAKNSKKDVLLLFVSIGTLAFAFLWTLTHGQDHLESAYLLPIHGWISLTLAPRIARETLLGEAYEIPRTASLIVTPPPPSPHKTAVAYPSQVKMSSRHSPHSSFPAPSSSSHYRSAVRSADRYSPLPLP